MPEAGFRRSGRTAWHAVDLGAGLETAVPGRLSTVSPCSGLPRSDSARRWPGASGVESRRGVKVCGQGPAALPSCFEPTATAPASGRVLSGRIREWIGAYSGVEWKGTSDRKVYFEPIGSRPSAIGCSATSGRLRPRVPMERSRGRLHLSRAALVLTRCVEVRPLVPIRRSWRATPAPARRRCCGGRSGRSGSDRLPAGLLLRCPPRGRVPDLRSGPHSRSSAASDFVCSSACLAGVLLDRIDSKTGTISM